ncbi:glycosyltransferase family 2 protein [Mucilaginibacter jinjuensis]|uniref:Glycosyltransferase family A protein n=1 Tax=Mucilaginibacter jinjuensis TaxID=1176721 RepID=A0ABY7TH36_9SPHI|nr:glycosyltransferase family A protein [Mucilaginibacter jinjuensis]WCT14482.1 glycosyltransferase family A protein [Mucilaginibacter jinjuensis]
MLGLKISFCTVAMNRLHHLRQTLPVNIADNLSYGNLEFVILDYNSNDGLQDWIRETMHPQIKSGILKFFRTDEPKLFNRSHSRNMAFRLGKGDILCNIDADNFTGPGFADYINKIMQNSPDTFITPSFHIRDIIGKLAIRRADFWGYRGYNEEITGYGFEDIELYKRLTKYAKNQHQFSDKQFTRAIYHSNEERVSNEFISVNSAHIFVRYINPDSSELYFLYKDGSFEFATFIDKQHLPVIMLERAQLDNMVALERPFQSGFWKYGDQFIQLFKPGTKGSKLKFSNNRKYIYNNRLGIKLYEITSTELKNEMILLKTEVENRLGLSALLSKPLHEINSGGFGLGSVIRNFQFPVKLEKCL